MNEQHPQSSVAPASRTDLGWRTATVAAVVLAIATVAFVVAYAAGGFLLLFAGLLFATLLDALTRGLGYLLPIRRSFRLAIVCVTLALLIFGFIAGIGIVAIGQAPALLQTLDEQVSGLRDALQALASAGEDDAEGQDGAEGEGADGLTGWLPDPSGMLGQARAAFATVFGVVGNIVVIIVLGLFLAAQPQLYRNGAVRLVAPSSRHRFGEVLDEIGKTLRYWLVGQAITMTVIGIVVWIALVSVGMPGALLLALVSGLLNFIPMIGPILAGIPIVLVGMSQGTWMAVYGVGVYTFIQLLEGNVLTPLIQRRAVHLPPALIFTAQVILGFLFGFVGLILATPLAAAGKVAVQRLYLEDVLGDHVKG